MTRDNLKSGVVIRYSFLWGPERQRGETEGRKPRPAVIGFRLDDDLLLLFPITTREPEGGRFAREIPDTEKRRAGLNPHVRSWIILDEINTDSVSRSHYLEPGCEIGQFSRAFYLPLFRAWIKERENRRVLVTARES